MSLNHLPRPIAHRVLSATPHLPLLIDHRVLVVTPHHHLHPRPIDHKVFVATPPNHLAKELRPREPLALLQLR